MYATTLKSKIMETAYRSKYFTQMKLFGQPFEEI